MSSQVLHALKSWPIPSGFCPAGYWVPAWLGPNSRAIWGSRSSSTRSSQRTFVTAQCPTFLRAHCPAHGPTCTRQRQTTQGKSYGSGRPIGMLVAWLEDASRCKSKAEHVAQPPQAFLRRQAARELFQSWPGSGGMLGHERPQSAIESSEEPDEIK